MGTNVSKKYPASVFDFKANQVVEVDIYTGELELKISDSTLPGSSLSVTR